MNINTRNIFFVLYETPNRIKDIASVLMDHLSAFSQKIMKKLILVGDFNIPDIDWNSKFSHSALGKTILKPSSEWNLNQIIDFPIQKNNTFDSVFVSNSMNVFSVDALPPVAEKCDNIAILFRIGYFFAKPKLRKVVS